MRTLIQRNRGILLVVLICLLFFGCSRNEQKGEEVKETGEEIWIISKEGVGPVKMGMTYEEVEDMLGEPDEVEFDANKKNIFYKKQMLALIFGDNKLDTITIGKNDQIKVKTKDNITFDSSLSEVEKIVGPNHEKMANQIKSDDIFYIFEDGKVLAFAIVDLN